MPASYRCADASDERDEPMLATASRVRGWLLIEVRGAWGADAIHSSAFGPHAPRTWKDRLREQHVRAVCIRSHLRSGTTAVRLFACGARRPGTGRAELWTREVESLTDVMPAVARLDVHGEPPAGWAVTDERVLLVCANGRHDQCCANRGRPLIRSLRESPWADRVWECSHVGGDRFAANLVVLPDSLYFGRVDPDDATALLDTLVAGRIDLDHFRGRSTFSVAEQAVEHFVRHELGLDGLDAVTVDGRDDDGTFRATAAGRPVAVRIRRTMTSVAEPISCKGSSNQLVPTFTLRSIDV